MKIVLATAAHPSTTGGVQSHVRALSAALVDEGQNVEIWAFDRAAPRPTISTIDDVAVRGFPASRSERFPLSRSLLIEARRATRRPGAQAIDVFHVHSFHASASLAALTVAPEVPVVFTPHYHGGGHTTLARLVHLPYRPLGRAVFRRADAVIAVSKAEATAIVADMAVPVDVIHNGAEGAAIRNADPRPDAGSPVVIVGRLEAYKRVDLVIDAFGRSTLRGPLVIIGDGPDAPRLRRLAAASPRAREIHIAGRVSDAELHGWLRAAQLLVSMSEHEAFGVVALEGVAGGAHVILSDIPAHREVAGLLPPDRVAVVDSRQLGAEFDRLGDRPNVGPTAVREWREVAHEHLQVYRRIVNATSRPNGTSA